MELDACELPEDLSHLLSKISQDVVEQGAFGDIWKCCLSHRNVKDLITRNKVDVAVKVLRILPYDDGGKENVRREIGIWRRMQHKHIVPFFGVANHFIPSRISLVSYWQSNGTLTSLLERKHDMNYKYRLLLLQDIASGLCYLHSVDVVHGDLTGSNVLIDSDGHARLTDFGLSSLINAGEGMTYLAITTRRPGALRWVAPELVVKDSTGIAPTFGSDIYSFGSVMLQTLSGRLPWSEIKNPHIIIIIIKLYEECLPQRPESLHILDAHWDFIMLCMNLVVESRPEASEVMRWIKEAISSWDKSIISFPQVNHYTMRLNNYLQAKYGTSVRSHAKWVFSVSGPAHCLTWVSTVYIDDIVYGKGGGSSKRAAHEAGAGHAVDSLAREGIFVP